MNELELELELRQQINKMYSINSFIHSFFILFIHSFIHNYVEAILQSPVTPNLGLIRLWEESEAHRDKHKHGENMEMSYWEATVLQAWVTKYVYLLTN